MKVTARFWQMSYSETIDLWDIIEERGTLSEQGLTLKQFLFEHRPLQEFLASDIERYNGQHYIYGWWECLLQSDNCPNFIRENHQFVRLVVE